MSLIFITLARVAQLYSYLLIARVLLTWFPVDWYAQPYAAIKDVTDPYLKIFRFIPPLGMLDLSPMLAIFVLYIVEVFFISLAASF